MVGAICSLARLPQASYMQSLLYTYLLLHLQTASKYLFAVLIKKWQTVGDPSCIKFTNVLLYFQTAYNKLFGSS